MASRYDTTQEGQRNYLAYMLQCVIGKATWRPDLMVPYYVPKRPHYNRKGVLSDDGSKLFRRRPGATQVHGSIGSAEDPGGVLLQEQKEG